MISILEKFAGFKVIEFFLANPDKNVSIRELAKILKTSPSTTKHYIDLLIKENLLNNMNLPNTKTVKLNNKNPIVRKWKSAYLITKLKEYNIDELIKNPFYVFGSTATGDYNQNSDIDIFVIKSKEYDKDKVKEIGRKIKKDINIINVPFYKLDEYKQKNKELISEIKNHGLYFGEELHELQ